MAAVATSRINAASNGKIWHAQYPELGTGPVPIEPYISQEYFALERERIFRKVWLNVGRVRAFHNVCSHRSNKLVWNRGGSCQMFACKFHGWTYGLDGQLSFVPD